MTKNPPPVKYCWKHGCRLIRKHYYWLRKEEHTYAASKVWERDVPARCIYETADPCGGKGR